MDCLNKFIRYRPQPYWFSWLEPQWSPIKPNWLPSIESIVYCVVFGPSTVDQRNVHWGCTITLNTTFRGKSELNKFIVLSIIAHIFSSSFNVFLSSINLTKIQRKLDNHKSIRASGMIFLNKLCYYKKRHCLDFSAHHINDQFHTADICYWNVILEQGGNYFCPK